MTSEHAKSIDVEHNRRILIVDDNKAIHDDFRKVLGAAGEQRADLDALEAELFGSGDAAPDEAFELDSAFQGEEAIARATEALRAGRPYALAFVDVRMPPGIDGVTTTARLLELDPDLGIVICSAYSDHSWDEMAEAIGDTDRVLILKKPFDTVEVRQLAHALQRRWELARLAALRVEDLTALVSAQTRELQAANARLQEEAAARERALAELAESNERIRELAFHDQLTGLPNRRLFNEYLDKTLARAAREGSEFAVLFVDFDNFKLINDTVGHHAADALLRELAESLGSLVRSEDVLALYSEGRGESVLSRLGGDEFVILLPGIRDRFSPGAVAQRILEHLNKPIRASDHEVFVTASIGIASYPHDGDTADLLVRNADTAMYHAKQQGKAGFQYYSQTMNAASVERLTLESGLRRALDQQCLELHYQPQIDVRTGRITGAEALLRWNHPQRGYISPGSFIPLAEETGLILPIGEWVMRQACKQAVAWQRAGLPPVPVSVNVSAVQFGRQDVCELARAALEDSGLAPGLLGIEITESAIMSVRERATGLLAELRGLGVGLALDDFGTGYSSLSYLKRFPINMLKIDRSFVAEILTDTTTASITRAIITMAHVLGLDVLAEGVEDSDQLELLAKFGCDFVQGFYFSRAVPAEDFVRLLEKSGSGAPRLADAALG